MKQRRGARDVPIWAAWVLVLAGTPGCLTSPGLDRVRGQSGSEVVSTGGSGNMSPGGNVPGADTMPCPCNFPVAAENVEFAHPYARTATLRVTVLARDAGAVESEAFPWCGAGATPEPGCARVQLRVEEVLGGSAPLEPGVELEASNDGRLPCFVGTDAVQVGGEALAQLSWPLADDPSCEALDGTCPAPPPLSSEQLTTLGSARLTAWEEQLLFAATDEAELRVPASELSTLSGDFEQCIMRFGDWADLPGAFPQGNLGRP
jgi:hypothetical protein